MIPEISFSPTVLLWITSILSIIIILAIRDFATSFVKGMAFKLNKDFSPGDQVYLDGKLSVIISIGIKQTVFQLTDDNDTYRWRYIPNERIPLLELEKVIFREGRNGS
jgi:small-conductance mechanosensitive channel